MTPVNCSVDAGQVSDEPKRVVANMSACVAATSARIVADILSAATAASYRVPHWTGTETFVLDSHKLRAHGDIAWPAHEFAYTAHSFPSHVLTNSLGLHREVAVSHVVAAKLARLEALQDGWLGPGSVRPSRDAMRHYMEFLISLDAFITLDAEAVATAEGAVRIEWDRDGAERVIEFNADGSAWLYDSEGYDDGPLLSASDGDDAGVDLLVDPFDIHQVTQFFVDGMR